jgi:hypothetical protein
MAQLSQEITHEVKVMLRTTILFFMVSFTGATSAEVTNQVNTLGTNDAIPNSLIEAQANGNTADVLLETPYKGFYQIKSKVKNRNITFDKVVTQQSFPDERWKDMATDIASLVEIPAYSTGSRIAPKATAYVVFYDVDMPGLDRSNVMLLPTTTEAEPNTLIVLVIEHQNHSRSQGAQGVGRNSADENGDNIYFFELAM